MGGGLMQLIAYGAQDVYLSGNPQITFFKVVYRRHTNFSMESIKQLFDDKADFGKDVTSTIGRNGDLISKIYLEHNAKFEYASATEGSITLSERYGDSLIKQCEIEIGGQKIDKYSSMWSRVYSDLTEQNNSGLFGGSEFPQVRNFNQTPLDASTADTQGKQQAIGAGKMDQLMKGNTFGFNTSTLEIDSNDLSSDYEPGRS